MSWERDCKCSDCRTTGQASKQEISVDRRNNKVNQIAPVPMAELRTEYAQAASDAAAASADIALYEAKAGKARAKYEEAKARRDALKRQIAEHPEA